MRFKPVFLAHQACALHFRPKLFSGCRISSLASASSESRGRSQTWFQGNRLISTSHSLHKDVLLPGHVTWFQGNRPISTSHSLRKDVLLPGNVVQSPFPDVVCPDNSSMHQIIFERCDLFKDELAVSDVATGKSYTYSELKEKSVRVASALSRKGFKKGDIIMAFSTNQADFSVLMLAASCLGLWFTAANPAFTSGELVRQMNHCEAVAVFTQPAFVSLVEEALHSKDFTNKIEHKFVFGDSPGWQPFQTLIDDDGKAFPDVDIDATKDVYALPYSSGTTGFPKGVMLTHFTMVANLLQVDCCNGMEKGDNILGLLPLYHAYGQLITQFGTFYCGGHLHNLTHFEPETFLKCLQDRQITYANLVPPLILFLTKHPMVDTFDLSKLDFVSSAAAPLGRELTNAFLDKFPHIKLVQGYGLTEASPGLLIDVDGNVGSVGPLLPNSLAKVVDIETGEALGPNQEGELCFTGPQVMEGYFKNQQATDDMIRDGWLYTGDIAYYDEKGLFYISDRLKELIKYKAMQVAPAELEAVLIGCPGVADVCVVGKPDERAGEVPKAFVVKSPGSEVTEEDIVSFVESRVSDAKKLRGGVEFIDAIPRNPSGKILRRLLR